MDVSSKSIALPSCRAIPDSRVLCERSPANYRAFLQAIATRIGLGFEESLKIVNDVCMLAKGQGNQENYPRLKILLSKILVRKCISTISVRIFSESTSAANYFQDSVGYVDSISPQRIPLSYRIVFILFQEGFSEEEMGEILNITQIQVRTRLAKAFALSGKSKRYPMPNTYDGSW